MKSSETIAKGLRDCRAKIASLQAERIEVQRAPDSRAETIEYWRARCEVEAAGRERAIAYNLAARGDGQPLAVTARGGESIDLLPTLAALLGADRMLELLMPHLDALPEGLTAAKSRARLAEIDAQIASAEHLELDLIEALEAAGVLFTWRGDMSPAVLLRV